MVSALALCCMPHSLAALLTSPQWVLPNSPNPSTILTSPQLLAQHWVPVTNVQAEEQRWLFHSQLRVSHPVEGFPLTRQCHPISSLQLRVTSAVVLCCLHPRTSTAPIADTQTLLHWATTLRSTWTR